MRFLKFDKQPAALRTLRLDEIDAFLRQAAKNNSRSSLSKVVDSVRGFLRHLHAKGILNTPLHQQVDTPRTYRLEQLPRTLSWKQVVAFLRSIDRSDPTGLRDFTLLYLAARYGLRNGELVRLTLDDIDWRAGILQVSQSKNRQILQLPLTDEAGEVLTRYLRDGRPPSSYRQLFLRQNAPVGPLTGSAVIRIVVHWNGCNSLSLPHISPHMLRHSLAVHLLRRGVGMDSIGNLLGHRVPESTSIYLRLDLNDLRTVGLHLPRLVRPATLNPGWRQKLPLIRTQKLRPRLSQAGFGSPVAESLKLYLANRRALGRCFTKEENILRRWDKFLQEQFPHQHRIRPDMFHDWTKTMPYLTPNIRRSNLMIVRNFLRFHVRSHPNTYVPDPVTFPKRCPYRLPRLVTPEEMAQVLATAKQLHTFNTSPVRAQTVHLALALLFCCGLRRSELLRLRLRHFDSHEKVLRIEQTKFHKSRLVPLSRSVARLVDQYLVLRKRLRLPTQPDSPLIWSKRHLAPTGEVCASTLVESWHQLCLAVGVLDERGRPPHLHDLRHSFAVVALHRWYQQGLDVPAKLPHLATYLGHVGAASTQHYLHLTPDLREAASQRFHRFAPDILGNGGGQ